MTTRAYSRNEALLVATLSSVGAYVLLATAGATVLLSGPRDFGLIANVFAEQLFLALVLGAPLAYVAGRLAASFLEAERARRRRAGCALTLTVGALLGALILPAPFMYFGFSGAPGLGSLVFLGSSLAGAALGTLGASTYWTMYLRHLPETP